MTDHAELIERLRACRICGQDIPINIKEPIAVRAARQFCSLRCRHEGGRLRQARSDDDIRDYLQRKIIIAPSGCWEWHGTKNKSGYGSYKHGGKTYAAHRTSYQLFVGPITDGLWVLHRCDNRPCINPKHLFLGTVVDNMKDAVSKRRHAFGSRQACAKLSVDDVIAIRNSSAPTRELMEKYGVAATTIRRAKDKNSWRVALAERQAGGATND